MIVNVIEIFIEYMSIMLCLHKAAKKKMEINKHIIIFALLNLICVLLSYRYREEYSWITIVMFINFFVYTRMFLCEKWLDSIRVYGIMLVTIPSLQMIIYFCIKFVLDIIGSQQIKGIVVNCIICLLIYFWKKEYIFYAGKWMIKSSGLSVMLVFWSFFAYLLYLYKQSDSLNEQITFQSFVGVVGLGTIFILWINAENGKRNKERELKLYELYNKTFEDAIIAIRIRQHEFDNHINAIKCLQYTISNPNDLVKAQNEYCDKILRENSFNKLLKLHTNPIMIGFLYSKLTFAKEQNIEVLHEVHEIEIKKGIDVNMLVEIIGIFIDNAVEALLDEESNKKTLIVKVLQEDTGKVSIEVANSSRKYLNGEIEKFCIYGYSTKGKNRGIGLSRVKEIVKRNKGDFFIENLNYNEENYLSFKVILDR